MWEQKDAVNQELWESPKDRKQMGLDLKMNVREGLHHTGRVAPGCGGSGGEGCSGDSSKAGVGFPRGAAWAFATGARESSSQRDEPAVQVVGDAARNNLDKSLRKVIKEIMRKREKPGPVQQ